MVTHFDWVGLAGLAPVLNSMAMLIAMGGAWLLLATRWRQLLAVSTQSPVVGTRPAIDYGRQRATQRINRFFYGFGFASLALAWLLSTLLAFV